jgi:dimeric dUTPase (all-alpha-NTP-PPase superfamily)
MKDIFEKQASFNKNFIDSSANLEAKQVFTKDVILHLSHELHEILDEINWKMHKSHTKDIDVSRIKEEVIDSFKYLLNIAITWGITAEEFVEMFYSKSFVVEKRLEMEKSLSSLKASDKVCAFDIDGVLTDYPRCWVEYCCKRLGNDYLSGCTSPYKAKERLHRYENPVTLSKMRHEYRSSGLKAAQQPTQDNIAHIFECLRKLDYKIVLISARPFEKYPRIFLDTLRWLQSNNLEADAILFDKNKHVTITKYFPK